MLLRSDLLHRVHKFLSFVGTALRANGVRKDRSLALRASLRVLEHDLETYAAALLTHLGMVLLLYWHMRECLTVIRYILDPIPVYASRSDISAATL